MENLEKIMDILDANHDGGPYWRKDGLRDTIKNLLEECIKKATIKAFDDALIYEENHRPWEDGADYWLKTNELK